MACEVGLGQHIRKGFIVALADNIQHSSSSSSCSISDNRMTLPNDSGSDVEVLLNPDSYLEIAHHQRLRISPPSLSTSPKNRGAQILPAVQERGTIAVSAGMDWWFDHGEMGCLIVENLISGVRVSVYWIDVFNFWSYPKRYGHFGLPSMRQLNLRDR